MARWCDNVLTTSSMYGTSGPLAGVMAAVRYWRSSKSQARPRGIARNNGTDRLLHLSAMVSSHETFYLSPVCCFCAALSNQDVRLLSAEVNLGVFAGPPKKGHYTQSDRA